MKDSDSSGLWSGILNAGAELQKAQDAHYEKLAKSFAGIRIIENPALPDNEIAVMCGKTSYQKLLSQSESPALLEAEK
ncbi:MAG: hypothetical protein JKY93_12680 [Gammaproteobacteria bacterium]|nr:hypothetical protein [Gammaproteobacteria bacterium]